MDPALIKAVLDAITADDPEALKKAATDLLAALAAPGGSISPSADDPLASDAEPPPAKLAALKALRTLTGCTSLGEAVEAIKAWKAERDQDSTNAAALEETSRAELVGELVKLGYETPATAWVDAENGKKKPAAHLAALSVAALRSRVAAFKVAPKATPGFKPPTSTETLATEAPQGGKVVTLSDGRKITISAAEIVACKKRNMSHEDFAAQKATAVKRV